MPENVQYLVCNCGVRNEAKTHQLTPDNWFQERFIDFAVCRKCGKNLLQKRYFSVSGEYIVPQFLAGYEKVYNKYQKLLEEKIQTFSNDFLKSVHYNGGLMRGVYYSVKGIQYRTDHIPATPDKIGRKWNGKKWLRKINGKFK